MRTIRWFFLSLAALSAFAAEPTYDEIMRRFNRAKAAIEAGEVDNERHLAPLVAMLKMKDGENLERVVDKLSDLGSASGSSPAAVKQYLLAESTPSLIAIAENTANKWSLRGSAIHALRDMGAPRAVLQRITDMALADSNDFVKSRGEILANYIRNMPQEDENAAVRPADAAKEQQAIAFLRERRVGVSLDQLRLSAIEAKHEEVAALLAAGVDPNAGPAADAPIVRALSACSHQGGETDDVVKTVQTLIDGGADLQEKDDNANTPLMSAAQYCGEKVVTLLLTAGAEANVVNGSGITPLAMAMIMNKLDAAEALVAKGARLTSEQAEMVSGMATDARAKAVLKKATAKKK